jgi:CheY-like chemotaxis protein
MRLPDTDGLTLLRELRAQPETSHIPCVALSASALPEDVAQARQQGFVDYWTKPLDAAQFLRGIDTLLAAR